MPRRHRSLLAFVIFALLVSFPATASAEAYDDDPHRLVPFKDSVQGVYTTGIDEWEVWICDAPDWDSQLDLTDEQTQ